ncbi:MAG: gamma-glutamyltransferase family protein [Alphaproteobacteria bacterium]
MYEKGLSYDPGAGKAPQTMRPVVMGHRHMISAGHYLAAEAGFRILEAGGNAVDAGVAAGIALGVVQSDLVSFAGVAPIMIRMARAKKPVTIDGLGVWPKATEPERYFNEFRAIPAGLLRTVVPAAPDAWITALARFGTMSFGEVAESAIRLARDGFAMHPLMAENIETFADGYRRWPANAAIYLPQGRPPKVGEKFVQRDLARTLQYMVDQEKRAARRGRKAALKAARDAFYRGDIAKTFADYHRKNGGTLTMDDMAAYRVEIGEPEKLRFHGADIYTCGPWCQGPVLLQALSLLESVDLAGLGHNSVAYIHTVAEALKLAFADRDRHYTDPRHARVPMAALLSKRYAAERRKLIRHDRAWTEMPPPGDPSGKGRRFSSSPQGPEEAGDVHPALDTSYVAVIDRHGNAFSATPSDTSYNAPIVPGTGLCPSSRGSQSWAVEGHSAAVAPGVRPRLTPNPAMMVQEGRAVTPFGTPGGDVQSQAMLQALLNVMVFGMDVQRAVETPRFATFSFPNSFEPHNYYPGRLNLEQAVGADVGKRLAALGHQIEWWPDRTWRAGGMCMVAKDLKSGLLSGGADPRRPSYALGW